MSSLPVRAPQRTLETAPFWDGCARGELVLPRCNSCEEFIWYPRRYCPLCHTRSVRWEPVAGTGRVYSFTVQRKGAGAYRNSAPYVLAYVELTEGPRLLTNVVDVDVETVHIGMPVRVVFDPIDADALPRFAPS